MGLCHLGLWASVAIVAGEAVVFSFSGSTGWIVCSHISHSRSGQLLALVDALHDGTLNEDQRETVHALRVGILALVEQECEVG
jgi:hypothetical protein